MRRISVVLSLLILTTALASQTLAADAELGKALVEQKCTSCHKNEVYGREIKSLAALQTQVDRCAVAAKTDWSPTQKADVVNYLNKEFYKFK